MNLNNRKQIQDAVRDAGLFLEGKLPEHPEHAERNSYAHIWRSIKEAMGKTYKDCDDDEFDAIMAVIVHCKNNPV